MPEHWYTTPRPLNDYQRSRYRFFARLRAAELACPRCGWIVRIGIGSAHGLSPGNPNRRHFTTARTAAKHNPAWDPRRCLFCCPQCELKLVLGVAAWTCTSASGAIPTDSLPTLQEARVLRWLSPLWRRGLRAAAEAVGLGEGIRGPIAALRRVRAGLRSGSRGASVDWAAYGAVLYGTLCRARGAMPRGKIGPQANLLIEGGGAAQGAAPGTPSAPGEGLLRAEVAELEVGPAVESPAPSPRGVLPDR